MIHLADKILEGSPAVMELLSKETKEELRLVHESGHTVKAVRAKRRHLDFTRLDNPLLVEKEEREVLATQPGAFDATATWYHRSLNGTVLEEDYFPVLEKENESVYHFLKSHGWDRLSQGAHSKHGALWSRISLQLRQRWQVLLGMWVTGALVLKRKLLRQGESFLPMRQLQCLWKKQSAE